MVDSTDRPTSVSEKVTAIVDGVEGVSGRMDRLTTRLEQLELRASNTETITAEIKKDTSAIIELFDTIRGSLVLFKAIGSFIKWISIVAVGVATIYTFIKAIKTGVLPTININSP